MREKEAEPIIHFFVVFGGYVAGKVYKYLAGPRWALNILTTAVIFPVSLVLLFLVILKFC
jgi:hypothetical protein